MALAEFFDRAALAAAQVVAGFRREDFERLLLGKSVGIAFDNRGVMSPHSFQILDLAVRLAARLYPAITLQPSAAAHGTVEDLSSLARSINPRIDIKIGTPADIGLVVGRAAHSFKRPIYVGCQDWVAHVGTDGPRPIAKGRVPFGAGVAASIGMANVFRGVLDLDHFDTDLEYSVLGEDSQGVVPHPDSGARTDGDVVLVGCGAIGNAVAWALMHSPGEGQIHLVDHERVELSNLQRYVLSTMRDVGRYKVDVVGQRLDSGLRPKRHRATWAKFVARNGRKWPLLLVAVDSAEARCAIQSSLPKWVANAWTQPGDLGVSIHGKFGGEGACLACLYLRDGPTKNDDQVVAEALGISHRLMDVRNLLYLGLPVPEPLLAEIAAGLGRDLSELRPYVGLPIRRLYVEGICSGALVPSGNGASGSPDLHVPLAHQSALAGVLLAASLRGSAMASMQQATTRVTRIDILHPVGSVTTQSAAARKDGRCLCEDADFSAVYEEKWNRVDSSGRRGTIPPPR